MEMTMTNSSRIDNDTIRHLLVVSMALGVGLAGCDGYLDVQGSTSDDESPSRSTPVDGGGSTDGGGDDSVHDGSSPDEINRTTAVGVGGLKRLTRLEYDNTLKQLFGPPMGEDKAFGQQFLPGMSPKPFSNDFLRQKPTNHLVESLKEASEKAAARVVEELKDGKSTRQYVLGCSPSGPEDAACFRTFLRTFLRRAKRRPVEDKELSAMMTSFIYRRETGKKVEELSEGGQTVWKLEDYAIASRLSYFLTGGPPDDELLGAAAQGKLATAPQVREQAARLLETPTARRRMYQFHAAWLHFQDFWLGRNNRKVPAEQARAMRTETRKLMERVLFGDGQTSWLKLFRAEKTWVEPELADYYEFVDRQQVAGDSEQEDGAWVRYPEEGLRRGILSHGTFLTNGRRQNGDTHIIRRSEVILNRLMCNEIPPPPDDVSMNVDNAEGSEKAKCKVEKLDAATLVEGCQSCHYKLNKLGGALENFDNRGRYREYRSENQDCKIEGKGGLYERKKDKGWTKTTAFRGPGGLSETLVQEYDVAGCMVKHLYEFALGHSKLSEADEAAIQRLRKSFEESGYGFRQLVLDLVATKAFRYRAEPSEESQ
ncbi:MAG: DUF1592 domain-containing protein [Bradymonadaceae bacterium]